MTVTPSNMLPLGTQAPEFNLLDTVSGEQLSRDDVFSQPVMVVMFICNHCPFVVHINSILSAIARDYADRVAFVAISSNDVERYPVDGPEQMAEFAKAEDYSFPYLYDETQAVAKAYQAACTPDFYVFDDAKKCVYRGQFDDSRPGRDKPVTGNDLKNAIEATLKGEQIPDAMQRPSQGCNIKWK